MIKVAVCVITFRRPEGLRRLLDGVNALTFHCDPLEVQVIVVDNDPNGSAEDTCHELRSRMQWPLRYEVEPRRGIPFARNKAVACALETADFVAFLDDDEAPDAGWLDELMRVQRAHDADVVTGPVLPHLSDDVPGWIVKGRFFESRRYPTGQRIDVAYTHNVMARGTVFRTLDKMFDESMALTGGSDSHYFRRVHRAGFTIIWADTALVHEWIPRSRACFGWLVRRSYRVGNSRSLAAIDLGSPWWTRLVLAVKALVWMGIGVLLVPCGLVIGRPVLVKGIRSIAYGAGYLASIVGARYREYKTANGT